MTKFGSDIELCNLAYGHEYPKAKSFKSLRSKRTFHVSVLGAYLDWYDEGRIIKEMTKS